MKYINKEIEKLYKSISNNSLTIYGGIYSSSKVFVIKELISRVKQSFNVISLNFNIFNLTRYYSMKENIEHVENLLKPNVTNIIFIWEFTNCDEWYKILEHFIKYKRVKIFAITSSDFSGYLSFTKYNKFCLHYKEEIFFPPPFIEFLNYSPKIISNYLDNGSVIWGNNNHKIIELTNDLNITKLFNIFTILTKVRNHFHLEIFFSFLIRNIDKKLTLDFIKKTIITQTKLQMKNTKTFWKYINLLQVLYILIPLNSYCISRKQERFNSRYVCIDHMLFKKLDNVENEYFLIGRNILIMEFIKNNLKVLLIEENNEEIGFFGKLSNNKIVLFKYTNEQNASIKKLVNQKNIEESDTYIINKKITKYELEKLLIKVFQKDEFK